MTHEHETDTEVISDGIQKFEKFKAAANEAIARAREAEKNAQFFKGQCEQLQQQKASDDARHRTDLLRIAELESFIATVTELYTGAAEKLRLGGFRRPTSVPVPQDVNLRQLEAEISDTIKKRHIVRPEPVPPLVLTDHVK